jgi:hypothetical protein
MTAGQVDQATRQAENTAKYNQFLQEQSLPYQQVKLASDIALGTGTASGSTTTTAQPGGFFSDERLKENIKAVGKTFDGQTIHSFNYKGDPRTQIGLIAQEVKAALDAEGVDTFAGWDEGPDGIQAISREMFISPLIKAIQEQQALITSLTARIAALETQ